MPTYYQDPSQLTAYGGNTDEDDEDLDYGDSDDPASDATIIQQAQQGNPSGGFAQPVIPEGPPGKYLSGTVDSAGSVFQSPDVPADNPEQPLPLGRGIPASDLNPTVKAPKLPWWKNVAHIALDHPVVQARDTGSDQVPDMTEARNTYQKIINQYPQRQAPNWLERIAAGALGGAAGWSNAARRAAPIDIGKVTEGVLYPGYDSKLAAWQSKVVPAQQTMDLAGQQQAAQWKGQQVTSESALKQAQTWMNLQRGLNYQNLSAAHTIQVTPEMEAATGGEFKAGTVVAGKDLSAALGRTAKTNPLLQKAQQLKQAFPNKTDEEVWQAVVNPSQVGRTPVRNEAQIKDQQLRADFASAVGKDPSVVTDAEMNAARRMFSTTDDLALTSLRKFIYEKKRLPNPAEERAITLQSIRETGDARRAPVPGEESIPTPSAGPGIGATKQVNGVPYQFDGTVWRKQAPTGGNQ